MAQRQALWSWGLFEDRGPTLHFMQQIEKTGLGLGALDTYEADKIPYFLLELTF